MIRAVFSRVAPPLAGRARALANNRQIFNLQSGIILLIIIDDDLVFLLLLLHQNYFSCPGAAPKWLTHLGYEEENRAILRLSYLDSGRSDPFIFLFSHFFVFSSFLLVQTYSSSSSFDSLLVFQCPNRLRGASSQSQAPPLSTILNI